MRSTYVARNASVVVVADEPKPPALELASAPANPVLDRTTKRDGLGSARGIFTAVVAGALIWIALGWSASILIDHLQG